MGDYRNFLKIKLCVDLLLSGGFHPNIEMRGEGLKKLFLAPWVSLALFLDSSLEIYNIKYHIRKK